MSIYHAASCVCDLCENIRANWRQFQTPPLATLADISPQPQHPRTTLADSQATLPTDSAARKDIPLARGVLDYFPAALAAVAELSRIGNEKHNPGEDLHWARGKSQDHADCIVRHLMERGNTDTDGLSHTVKVAWRALALLQEELESTGSPKARGAR